jgi:hypothetical protein
MKAKASITGCALRGWNRTHRMACATFVPSTNSLTLKSAYENSEISKNLNIDWDNRAGIAHNPFLFNAALHGTSIAEYN